MLRPQDTSSAPEGEYLATAGAVGAVQRRQASAEPEYQVVKVRGQPYHLPVLQALPQGGKGQGGKGEGGKGGKGKGRATKAHELDLHRTSATVLAEMNDPDAVECVRAPEAQQQPNRERPPPTGVVRGGRRKAQG